MPRPGADDAVRETLAFIRAHSAIRFIALPFFLGAIAALAKVYYDDEPPPSPTLLAATGLLLSLVAGTIEVVLSRNLIAWWHALDRHFARAPHWRLVRAHRDPGALTAARWTLFLPYVAAFVFWLVQLAGCIAPAGRGGAVLVFALLLALLLCSGAGAVWRRAAQEPPSGT
ncbi:hypothetical protein CKO37_15560 [Rubrivivax gelatinosus]|nr:hypothetical protein [Rubrivivax gelatinosus]